MKALPEIKERDQPRVLFDRGAMGIAHVGLCDANVRSTPDTLCVLAFIRGIVECRSPGSATIWERTDATTFCDGNAFFNSCSIR